MSIEILNRYTRAVIYKSTNASDLRSAVAAAVESDADLHDADLHGANLHDANLRGADLHGADLHDAGVISIAGHPWSVTITGHGEHLRVGCDALPVEAWRARTVDDVREEHGNKEADWWELFGPSILAMSDAMKAIHCKTSKKDKEVK